MIQDPTDQYIAAILAQYDLSGKDVLEIGCGSRTRLLMKSGAFSISTSRDPE